MFRSHFTELPFLAARFSCFDNMCFGLHLVLIPQYGRFGQIWKASGQP